MVGIEYFEADLARKRAVKLLDVAQGILTYDEVVVSFVAKNLIIEAMNKLRESIGEAPDTYRKQ